MNRCCCCAAQASSLWSEVPLIDPGVEVATEVAIARHLTTQLCGCAQLGSLLHVVREVLRMVPPPPSKRTNACENSLHDRWLFAPQPTESESGPCCSACLGGVQSASSVELRLSAVFPFVGAAAKLVRIGVAWYGITYLHRSVNDYAV